ncbi:MAG TPA: ABATE domain-containing protein [Microvirga sp.]|nr:ABATE domain-containing protein [Microvirga sp.]
MEKNTSIATLQLLGGHPSLDFANTVSARRGRWGPDLLLGFDDLLAWADRVGLLGEAELDRLRRAAALSPQESVAALERAKRLREAVYGVFSALAAGAEPPAGALKLVRKEYLQAQSSRALSAREGTVAWEWPDEPDLNAVTHRIAVHAVDLLTGPELRRVKECYGRDCGWLFFDNSRNASRRWCSDADCGTLARVTRHRMRARARPSCEEP